MISKTKFETQFDACVNNPELAEIFFPETPELYAVCKALYDSPNAQRINKFFVSADFIDVIEDDVRFDIWRQDNTGLTIHLYNRTETVLWLIRHR